MSDISENEKIGITDKSDWDEKWKTIFDHYQQDLRHAYYINSVLEHSDNKILEIGAGSFRDMALLNKLGIDCWGVDYSTTSVDLARAHFPFLKDKIFQSDAFCMNSISNKSFDVSFHNGFWVLFNDNDDIFRLVREQARITKNKIIVTVHNKHNSKFVDYFHSLSQKDSLYKIRFFTIDEVREFILSVCKSVEIIPVGKGKKYLEDEMINQGVTGRLEMRKFFSNMGLKHLEISERLMCIGYL